MITTSGDLIREHRESLDMTISDMVDSCNNAADANDTLTVHELELIENGDSHITEKRMIQFASVLGCEVTDLIGDDSAYMSDADIEKVRADFYSDGSPEPDDNFDGESLDQY